MYRILLVEDDPGIAQAVCAHLRQWELDARVRAEFPRRHGGIHSL